MIIFHFDFKMQKVYLNSNVFFIELDFVYQNFDFNLDRFNLHF